METLEHWELGLMQYALWTKIISFLCAQCKNMRGGDRYGERRSERDRVNEKRSVDERDECHAPCIAILSWLKIIKPNKKSGIKKNELFWNPNEALWKAISLSLNGINKTISGIHTIIAILKLIAKSWKTKREKKVLPLFGYFKLKF